MTEASFRATPHPGVLCTVHHAPSTATVATAGVALALSASVR